MKAHEIRAWAKGAIRGRRAFLLLCLVLAALPTWLILILGRSLGGGTFVWWSWPLRYLNELFFLCGVFVFLGQAQGRDKRLADLLTPLGGPWLKKAAAVALFFLVARWAVMLGPLLLQQAGQAKMEAALAAGNGEPALLYLSGWPADYRAGEAMVKAATWLNLILSLLSGVLLFPIPYLLFLAPDKGTGAVIREGAALGLGRFGTILAFLFELTVPLVVAGVALAMLAAMLSFFLLRHLPPVYLALVLWTGMALLFAWCFPYVRLALARFAGELIHQAEGEEEAPLQPPFEGLAHLTKELMGPPPGTWKKGKARLIRADGWYYCDMRKGPVKKGPLGRK